MNQKDFEVLVKETMDEINKLLLVKGGEYAGSEDRLANFKRGATLVGVTPLQTLFIYLSKHYDAIATFIRDDAQGIERPRSEAIEGRLNDLINYCLFAKALIRDKSTGCDNVSQGQKYPCGLSDLVSSEELIKEGTLVFPRWMKEHAEIQTAISIIEKHDINRKEGEMISALVEEGKLIPVLDEDGNFSGYKIDQREASLENESNSRNEIMKREEG